MKLTVKNLGAVSHAEIDLDKRLLIFTGENNTGKTYLVYTVYQLYQYAPAEWIVLENPHPLLPSDEIIKIKSNHTYQVNLLNLLNNTSSYLIDFEKSISIGMEQQLTRFFSASKDFFSSVSIDFNLDKKDILQEAIMDLEMKTIAAQHLIKRKIHLILYFTLIVN
jgi:plasmid maintenance system antidote protein VapI